MGNMRKRWFNLTLAGVVSAIAVVYMHVNTRVFQKASVNTAGWLSAHFMISVCYFAVPVFFMISGATLMDYRERYGTTEYFAARVKKTVVPFLFWSLFALFFQLETGQRAVQALTVPGVVKGILTAEYQPNYWFFLNLFSAYLLIPVFSLIPREKREKAFLYIMLTSFVLEKLVPFVNSAFQLSVPKVISMPLGTETTWFIFAGYYLQNRVFQRNERLAVYALGLLGLCGQIYGTARLSIAAGHPVETLRGSAALPNLLYSVAVFLFIKQISGKLEKNTRFVKLIVFLGGYTFGIYLIHRYVLNIISIYSSANTWNIFYRIFMPMGIIPVCIAIIWVIRKIPYIGKAVLPGS